MSGVGQKEVLMNSTEAVGELDLNNMQRFLRAVQADWLTGAAGSFVGNGTQLSASAAEYDRTKFLYCMGDSCAPFPDSLTSLRINNLAGPILQWKTGPFFPLSSGTPPANWGLDPYALIYWADFKELQTTHDPGDATNPRWDLVCVQLTDVSNDTADNEARLQKQVISGTFVISTGTFVKRRKVALTKQVIKGTPSGSPVIPSVPAGFQPYYAVLVPATFSSTFPVNDNFHDYRMPLGSFSIDVPAAQAIENGSGYAVTAGAGAFHPMTLGASSTWDFVPRIPITPSSCRLTGIGHLVGAATTNPPIINLGRYNAAAGGTYNQMGGNTFWSFTTTLTNNIIPGTFPAGTDFAWFADRLGDFTSSDYAGNVPPLAAAKPPWGTGRPSGYAAHAVDAYGSTNQNKYDSIGIRYTTAASTTLKMAFVRFYFAGMMF